MNIMGGLSRFSVGNFLSPVPKLSVGEPFCVSENSWYRKVFCVGMMSRFSVKG